MKPPADVKILLVEDDPFYLRALARRIAAAGYRVETAVNGREGMKAVVTFEPDVVVTGWMMPEMDGLDLCRSLKTGLGEAAPYVILLTARAEVRDRILGLESGADDYLIKPCDHDELLARIAVGVRTVSLIQGLRHAVADLRLSMGELGLDPAGGRPAPDQGPPAEAA